MAIFFQHPNRLDPNNHAADGCKCTLAPGAPSRPVPKEVLERLHRGATKQKGRQSNKADTEEQKAALRMEHGFPIDSCSLPKHGYFTNETALQHATNTSGADGFIGSSQDLAARQLLTPMLSPVNPPANPLNIPNSEVGYSGYCAGHGITTTGGHSVHALPDPQATYPAYGFGNTMQSAVSYPLPRYGNLTHGNDQSFHYIGNPNLSIGGSPFTRMPANPSNGMAIDSNTGLTGMAASAAEGIHAGHYSDTMHNCTCGPACPCIACPIHPFNQATRQHLKNSAMHVASGYFSDNQQMNDVGTHQSGMVPQSNVVGGENDFSPIADEREINFNTSAFHIYEASFSQAEMEANLQQAVQTLGTANFSQMFEDE